MYGKSILSTERLQLITSTFQIPCIENFKNGQTQSERCYTYQQNQTKDVFSPVDNDVDCISECRYQIKRVYGQRHEVKTKHLLQRTGRNT